MAQVWRSVKVYPDPASLAQAAAQHFAALAKRAIARRGRFSVALSGGETPRLAYSQLAASETLQLEWNRIHIFWGDERCVPPDHPDSNYRMARETLLEHIPIPPENIHRIHGEAPLDQAAAEYEKDLRAFFSEPNQESLSTEHHSSFFTIQSFDLLFLGLGSDGHTASLFPGNPALQMKGRWVTAVPHKQPPSPMVDRISLTLPAINAAAQVTFLVKGADKAALLKQVLSGPLEPQAALPAQLVRPASGELLWLVDQAAAGLGAPPTL